MFIRRIGTIGVPRRFVRLHKIRVEQPLEHLCMDIKYVNIYGARRNALLLTVLDVYSRKVLTNILRFNIKKGDVIVLLSLLLMEYQIKQITIRCDNGAQFIATVVRNFQKDKGVNRDFTHVATSQ
jgi:putative transposase